MRKIVEAVYENGVFRPLEPVALVEGEHVYVQLPERAPTPKERLAALDAFEQACEDLTEAQWQAFDEAVGSAAPGSADGNSTYDELRARYEHRHRVSQTQCERSWAHPRRGVGGSARAAKRGQLLRNQARALSD